MLFINNLIKYVLDFLSKEKDKTTFKHFKIG